MNIATTRISNSVFSLPFLAAAACAFLMCITAALPCSAQTKQQDRAKTELERSTKRAQNQQKFQLQYRMQPGVSLRWNVEQIAKTDTTMAGYNQKSSIRSRSVIRWDIKEVLSSGAMKIQNQLESANEWQRTDEEDPISYDSSIDTDLESVPDIFKSTADKVGKPIATTTIDASGKVIDREEHMKSGGFTGMGGFTMPLPAVPIHVGGNWETREELKAKRSNGTIQMIQTRMLYTLRKVENGIATISFRREALTPIDDQAVKSQIQQKMNQGVVLFDMSAGRIKKKVVQWDENVLGFSGDDSKLHYVGSYTMTLVENGAESATRTTSAPPPIDGAGNPLPIGQSGNPLKPSASGSVSSRVQPRGSKPTVRK